MFDSTRPRIFYCVVQIFIFSLVSQKKIAYPIVSLRIKSDQINAFNISLPSFLAENCNNLIMRKFAISFIVLSIAVLLIGAQDSSADSAIASGQSPDIGSDGVSESSPSSVSPETCQCIRAPCPCAGPITPLPASCPCVQQSPGSSTCRLNCDVRISRSGPIYTLPVEPPTSATQSGSSTTAEEGSPADPTAETDSTSGSSSDSTSSSSGSASDSAKPSSFYPTCTCRVSRGSSTCRLACPIRIVPAIRPMPVEAQPIESEPVKSQPIEIQPIEEQPTETKPAKPEPIVDPIKPEEPQESQDSDADDGSDSDGD